MLPLGQGLTEPASRTDWIQRPLLFSSGLASSGDLAQTDVTSAESVTFSAARMFCAPVHCRTVGEITGIRTVTCAGL